MLTYSFENIGPEPLYLHLYKCIKNDILDGVLPSGTKLPSKRSFAKNLGISNITVENAYAQLQAEGFIYSIPKKGFYVTELPENMPLTSDGHITSEAGRIAAGSIMEEEAQCKIDLVSNMTPPANFPFSIWAKLMREVISEKSGELMKKSPWGGIMELRSAISFHLKQFRNMDVAPEQIITGAGTEYLYTLIIQLLGYNKVYAVENPGYKKVAQIYKSNNVACEYIPVGSSGIVIEELEKRNADVAHISPSHHYPTGIITPVSRRYEILAWASRKKGRYIIEGLIVDELHQYNNKSGQGDAMAELYDTAKKVVGMTATLINGYSSGIFYLLYRIVPSLMKKDGKDYESPTEFDKEYGVIQTTYEEVEQEYNSNRRTVQSRTSTRLLPSGTAEPAVEFTFATVQTGCAGCP